MSPLATIWAKCCKSKTDDVDDSNVDAVIARNLWKNHRILPPTSKNKNNWDLFMVCAAACREHGAAKNC